MSLTRPLPSRRTFLAAAAGSAAGLAGGLSSNFAEAAEPAYEPLIREGDVILFQGDSITDAGRKRDQAGTPNAQPGMGNGYAWMAASYLLTSGRFKKLTIYNRGISGNKVPQLDERWQQDAIDLKPNVLSILIGVNDIWHKLNGRYDGTAKTYEEQYHALMERTRKALPDVRLVICEPFVLRTGAVGDNWFPEFDDYRSAAKRVAEKAGAVFVPFQAMFDAAIEYAPPEHWAGDGVHPSPFGAALMAHHWNAAVSHGRTDVAQK